VKRTDVQKSEGSRRMVMTRIWRVTCVV